MILISHRGNLSGPSEDENRPKYVIEALKQGYHVEVDVWYRNGTYYLGHDKPEHRTSGKLLRHPMVWTHAKDVKTLQNLLFSLEVHTFFLEGFGHTLTSRSYIWSSAEMLGQITKRSIIALPENNRRLTQKDLEFAHGICTDYVYKYGR